jgi:hypothetical protein
MFLSDELAATVDVDDCPLALPVRNYLLPDVQTVINFIKRRRAEEKIT